MKVVPSSQEGIQQALDVLRNGGVVAHATETCYGLACDLTNIDAVTKLFTIKHRPDTMPVSALFASIDQAKQYLEWNDLAEQLAQKYLPGPLTIILKERTDAPKSLLPTPSSLLPTPSIGLRISSHPTASALVEAFGSPLSTTSANLHGKENPYSVEDLEAVPDIILDDGPLQIRDASTVVDVSTGMLHILRKGDIALERV
ncbi:MAG: threonylcarbamoyl-AMP synthase [Candidatus Peregrinibacteria bacterium]|nr:threonylcarbamoyl-AMP synthase [Candidatus Peregrinibacteria bacterium]MCB9807929.1 threonylcarbamoyl-AMP synthase [Candidatus Peribacteria bacterium]